MGLRFLWMTSIRVDHQVCDDLVVQSGVTDHRGGIVREMSEEDERETDLLKQRA